MIVKQLKVGTMANFVYLVADPESREAIVVDSGWETEPIVEAARVGGFRVKYVLATHEHFDHTRTIHELADRTGAQVLAHALSPLEVSRRLEDGDKVRVGSSELEVIHTPGHTEDSICLYDQRNLFTGDTLFIGTCGRTDLPGGSTRKLFESLHSKIMRLPGETEINPGHDYGDVPRRQLSEEVKRNPALLAGDLRSFLELFS